MPEDVELVAPVPSFWSDFPQEMAASAVDAARSLDPLVLRAWSPVDAMQEFVFSMVLSMEPKSNSGNVCWKLKKQLAKRLRYNVHWQLSSKPDARRQGLSEQHPDTRPLWKPRLRTSKKNVLFELLSLLLTGDSAALTGIGSVHIGGAAFLRKKETSTPICGQMAYSLKLEYEYQVRDFDKLWNGKQVQTLLPPPTVCAHGDRRTNHGDGTVHDLAKHHAR